MGFSEQLKRLRSYWITQHDIRAEAFALGSRHHGQVLEGAAEELKASNLPFRRAILLRAVIRSRAR